MIEQDISENQVNLVYLGIGSNLGNKINNIELAKSKLILNDVMIVKSSSYYESLSWPDNNNPKFYNVVVKVLTKLSPFELISVCKTIETSLGRKKRLRNAPRECDIDIIDFNKMIHKENNLILPHPKCHLRNFVLFPILQIDPNWFHPIIKKNAQFLINKLSQKYRIEITRLRKNVNILI